MATFVEKQFFLMICSEFDNANGRGRQETSQMHNMDLRCSMTGGISCWLPDVGFTIFVDGTSKQNIGIELEAVSLERHLYA